MRTIRTQSKQSIVNLDQIKYISTKDFNMYQKEYLLIVAYYHEDYIDLGIYTTEKRRARVMDMLESWMNMYLCPSNIALCLGKDDKAFAQLKDYMRFQMPADNDLLDAE